MQSNASTNSLKGFLTNLFNKSGKKGDLAEMKEEEVADRKLNIERMMEELEAMKRKKAQLIERNNRLKEN